MVSVIIPVYNGESVLPAQLAALAEQTYQGNLEIVVADNGSTDGTREVALAFAGRFEEFRVLDASAVRGPSHARNVGGYAARGDLLLFCDADDVVSSTWVGAMVGAASTADLLAGVGVETDRPETQAWSATPIEPAVRFRFLPWHRSSNLAFRREVFEAVGGFDESRVVGEDVDICWRVQLAGYRFAFVAGARVAYRDRDTTRALIARQFRFGRAAPGLYRDFADWGAPHPGVAWLLGSTNSLFRGLPRASVNRSDRRRWLVSTAGVVGRWLGVLEHHALRCRNGITSFLDRGTERT